MRVRRLLLALPVTGLACAVSSPPVVVDDPDPTPVLVPEAEAPLSPEEVRTVIRAKIGEIRGCFDAGLARQPGLGGRLVLRFTIDARGRAQDISVIEDELHEAEATVAPCLLAALPRWQFPLPRDGGSMTLSYPFVFTAEDTLRAAELPRVQGTRSPAEIGAVFTAHRDELDACVGSADGSIGVALLIDDGGRVSEIASFQDSLPSTASRCVLATIAGWAFPPAATGDEVRVNHDLRW